MDVVGFTAPQKSYSCRETNHNPWLSGPNTNHFADYVCMLLILKQVKVTVKFALSHESAEGE